MAAEEPGVEPHDREAIEAYEASLAAFAEKLNLLHIAGGTPSYAAIASASVRPRLTTTGVNEMLSGKRLPSLESLLEFVRVVTTPSSLDKPAAQKFRADGALVETWRGHWQDTKLLQRRAQPAARRLKATVRQIHGEALREAEAVRTAAHAEAERIRTSAHTDAEDIRAQARRDADEVLDRARKAATAGTRDRPQRPGRRILRAGLLSVLGRGAALRSGLRPADRGWPSGSLRPLHRGALPFDYHPDRRRTRDAGRTPARQQPAPGKGASMAGRRPLVRPGGRLGVAGRKMLSARRWCPRSCRSPSRCGPGSHLRCA
ncbi:V-type ATP synthase subunit E family protein [Streptomyces yangpuensis]|uniref:hypothetical protein n=1 Tax=Streptomyces yangpuensis TaxID=1648182 RepID=UPI00366A1141